ncbi:MAG: alanine:cation symporter family protein [Clostridia bacterium]|nr:alanine:cation symporter family protein [Clostridia bacterium]
MEISYFLPPIVIIVGLYLLFKLKFFFLIHPVRTAKEIMAEMSDGKKRRTLCLALAGTLGVGNIFGVSAGIMIGGAGCVFWIFISSFLSMVIKYAEILLTSLEAKEGEGASAVLASTFSKIGGILGKGYAFFTVLLALLMGAGIQAEALCDVAKNTVGLNRFVGAFILLVLFMPCMLGGVKRIEKITEFAIPLTTIIYIFMCFCVIVCNLSEIPSVITDVFNSAFSKKAILGGGAFLAIREGFSRGILSNEAGVGSSAIAHARSKYSSPRTAGLVGICEVLFDTTLLCTLTGLVILLTTENIGAYRTPMSLVLSSFVSCLGELSGYILLLLIFAFAYSTVICWYFYGINCCELYFARFKKVFMFMFPIFFFASSVVTSANLLFITDLIILLMAVMILSAIIKRTDRICDLSIDKTFRSI